MAKKPSWKHTTFSKLHASEQTRRIMDNIQYFYNCADTADSKRAEYVNGHTRDARNLDEDEDVADVNELEGINSYVLTENDVDVACARLWPAIDERYGDAAMVIAYDTGIFEHNPKQLAINEPQMLATTEDMITHKEWKEFISKMERLPLISPLIGLPFADDIARSSSHIIEPSIWQLSVPRIINESWSVKA